MQHPPVFMNINYIFKHKIGTLLYDFIPFIINPKPNIYTIMKYQAKCITFSNYK